LRAGWVWYFLGGGGIVADAGFGIVVLRRVVSLIVRRIGRVIEWYKRRE